MPNILKPKRSNSAGVAPTISNLSSGELAVNMADRKIWINNGTNIVQVGSGQLSGLSDVVLSSLATGQGLSWNGTNWVNSSAGSGTVTSVGGTGTVSGLTLSGTVTGSGNLTLGGTLSLTSGNVTSALGFTPYNSTNPSGYITSSGSISGSAGSLANDAPWMRNRGSVAAASIDTATANGFYTQNNSSDSQGVLVFNSSGSLGPLQMTFTYGGLMQFRNQTDSSTWTAWKTVLTSANFGSYALPLSGGTLTGAYLDFSNSSPSLRITSGPGTFYIGDDDIVNLGSGAVVATPSSRISSGVSIFSTHAYATGQGDNKTHFGYYNGSSYVNYIRGAATYFDSGTLQIGGNQALHAGNYSSYALPLSGGTVTGVTTFSNASDTQIILNGGGTSWAGISWTDVAGTDYTWFNGSTSTFAIGGGGSAVSGKKLHVNGGMTIGSGYAATSNPTNGLNVEGAIQQAGNQVLHAGNYTSYSPSLGGSGASGIWGISVTGSARRIGFEDGPRNLSDRLPNSFTRTVNFDFVGAGVGNGSGNYAGVMTFSPWTGTSASTGDSSYQLAFANGSGVNASGQPKLSIRNGIDSTWNAWYTLLHDGNYSSYALPLSGGTVTGALNVSRQRLSFSSTYNDANHSIYNNYNNIDGEGGWDGMKMNVFDGLRIRVGNASGVTPATLLALSSSSVRINTQLQVGQNTNGTAHIDAFGGIARFSRDNTAYGLHLDGNNYASFVNANGYVTIGPLNTSHSHFQTDRPSFYFNKDVLVDGQLYRYSGNLPYLHSGNYTSYSSFIGAVTSGGNNGFRNDVYYGGVRNPIWSFGNATTYGISYFQGGAGIGGADTFGVSVNGSTSATGVNFAVTPSASYVNNNVVLHAGNYTSYSPSLTGSGASGTWGINITGSAGSVSGFKSFGTIYINPNGTNANCTTAQLIAHLTTLGMFNFAHSVAKCAWDYAGNNDLTDTGFGTVDMAGCVIETWINSAEKHVRITRPTTGAGGFQVLVYNDQGSGYAPGWRAMMTSENIASYAPTLSGGGASGTWSINVTGSAGSVAWSGVSGKPTTVAGYGITDAVSSSTLSSYLPLAGGSLTGNLSLTGNVTVNNASPTIYLQDTDNNSAMLHCNSNLMYILRGANNSTSWAQVGGYWPVYWDLTNNNATFGGSIWAAGNITAYSDEKLKTNWSDLADDFVARLAQVKSGVFDRTDTGKRQVGVSAQSLQKVLPEAVDYHEKEDLLSVAYGNAALAAAVELAKDNVDLRARVAKLEALVSKLIEG
jgi:hypothetical protein